MTAAKSVGFATLAIGWAFAVGFAPIASVANRWAIFAVSCPKEKDNCLFEEWECKNAKNKCQYVRLGCQFEECNSLFDKLGCFNEE